MRGEVSRPPSNKQGSASGLIHPIENELPVTINFECNTTQLQIGAWFLGALGTGPLAQGPGSCVGVHSAGLTAQIQRHGGSINPPPD